MINTSNLIQPATTIIIIIKSISIQMTKSQVEENPTVPLQRKHVCKYTNPETGIPCGQGFNERANLKVSPSFFLSVIQVHIRGVHTHEKPYSCAFCPKRFSVIGNRNDHMRRHAGIKPYKCPMPGCNHSYFRKYQLMSHGRSKKHSSISTRLFAFLVQNMPTPDLSVLNFQADVENLKSQNTVEKPEINFSSQNSCASTFPTQTNAQNDHQLNFDKFEAISYPENFYQKSRSESVFSAPKDLHQEFILNSNKKNCISYG